MRSEDEGSADRVEAPFHLRLTPTVARDTGAPMHDGISSRTATLSLELISLIESVDLEDYFANVPTRISIREILDGFSDREFEYFCLIYAEKLALNNGTQ